MRSFRTPQALPVAMKTLQALRAAGVSVQMHAGAAEGMGSMKSQFKKADASGARYALIFGADELAQGMVTVKSLRDGVGRAGAAAAGRARRLGGRSARLTTIAGSAAGYNRRLPTGQQDTMAKQLDLEEQEQLAEIKHFWNEYGNLITWALIVVFGSIAAWNGWQYWQRTQAAQAAAMYDEVERAAQAGRHERGSSARSPT